MSSNHDRSLILGVLILAAVLALAMITNSGCEGAVDDPGAVDAARSDARIETDAAASADAAWPLADAARSLDAQPPLDAANDDAGSSPDAAASTWTGWSGNYIVSFTTDSNPSPTSYATLDLNESTGSGVYSSITTGALVATITVAASGPTSLSLGGYCEGCGDSTCTAFGCVVHDPWIGTETPTGFVGDEEISWAGTGLGEIRHLVVTRL